MVQGSHDLLQHISPGVMCTVRLRMSLQFSASGNVEFMKMTKGSGIRNPYYGS